MSSTTSNTRQPQRYDYLALRSMSLASLAIAAVSDLDRGVRAVKDRDDFDDQLTHIQNGQRIAVSHHH
ncbi:hypothetical protein [Pseudomonas muyukensis]|uniref:Uncharacterized protein n=1 Tax=Pseudomonas muyukensis TaxID=2842357 RepID=A0ABX8M1L4_9PSED|nr:hypothetical protein [Pseudomonas muyukensis]QXH33202.1 hypothetical protein KSS95_13510 [Pseudomonas muyukensis]